jgi:hypothetical protein
MIKTEISSKPDLFGASASTLCAIHCLAAPFLFLAQASFTTEHIEVPGWYQMIDYLFLAISVMAVYYAVKNSSKKWMKIALWMSWAVLSLAIINETFEWQHLGEAAVYLPAFVLAGLHIYNKKYCQCQEACCT